MEIKLQKFIYGLPYTDDDITELSKEFELKEDQIRVMIKVCTIFNMFLLNDIKFRKIKEFSNPGKKFVIIEINYLEDIKLCKLTHKIEMEEEEFVKMIQDEDNDFEVKLEEVDVE
uniref:Uncharacterized protein n=1 Tax=Meloidogyne javanica TaxID=6303 RepID=A0A915N684_MELJA